MSEITELNGNGKIVVERNEIHVIHLGKNLAFSLSMAGPENYQNVMTQISQKGLLRPTTAQTFSLVDLALQNPNEEHCKDILNKLSSDYFWTSTENLWTPKEVIVYDNVGGNMPSDRESLLKMAKKGDKSVRIAYRFQIENQSVEKLLKNPYMLAQIGDEDMLNVVKRVAEGVGNNPPWVWALDKPSSDVKKYTTLDSGKNHYRLLNLGGDFPEDYSKGHGYAFGVVMFEEK